MTKYIKWTEEDDNKLKSLLSENKQIKDIQAYFPNRTIHSIKNRTRMFSNKSSKSSLWTEDKLNLLKQSCSSLTVKELSELLSIKESTVYSKLSSEGLSAKTLNKPWDSSEDKFFIDNFYKQNYTRIARKLGRTLESVQQRAIKLNLKKVSKSWSEEEVSLLKEQYSTLSQEELLNVFKRPASAIHNKAYKIGLSRQNSILKETEKLFIISNCGNKTDTELAEMFKCSIDTVKTVRQSSGIYKTGSEVKGPTYIEVFVKNILDENGIEYIFNQPLGDFRPDFQIKDTNLIIEVQGDYWHCNPKIYSTGPKDLIQMQHVLKDYVKNCFYVSNNYNVLCIWESDINQKPQEIKNEILNLILPSPKVI